MLLNVSPEPGDDDVPSSLQGAALDTEVVPVNGNGHAVRKEESHSGGRRFIEYLRDGNRVLVCDRDAVLSGL